MTARKSLAALAAAFGAHARRQRRRVRRRSDAAGAGRLRPGRCRLSRRRCAGRRCGWKEAAEEGHVGAAWLLGNLYDKGAAGVAQSDARAYEYYLQATRGGQPEAAVRLGKIYLEGNEEIGLKRNYGAALQAFEAGALAPRADAQYYLGLMHRKGWGTPVDRTESLRWYFLSAKKRYAC